MFAWRMMRVFLLSLHARLGRGPDGHSSSVEGYCLQAALAAAMEQRLAEDQGSDGARQPRGAARYVKLERRVTEQPLTERFAKYGRSVDGPKQEEGAEGVGRGRSAVWSAEERAAAMAGMDRVPASQAMRESVEQLAGRT